MYVLVFLMQIQTHSETEVYFQLPIRNDDNTAILSSRNLDLQPSDKLPSKIHKKLSKNNQVSNKLYRQYICIGYILGQRDIRSVISHGRGQCLSGAEEVPRAKPEALPSTGLSQGM